MADAGMDFEAVEAALNEQENGEQQSGENGAAGVSEQMVYQVEKMLFAALKKFHSEFEIPDDEIRINAKLLKATLDKYNVSAVSVEFLLFAHTASMLSVPVMKIIDKQKSQVND